MRHLSSARLVEVADHPTIRLAKHQSQLFLAGVDASGMDGSNTPTIQQTLFITLVSCLEELRCLSRSCDEQVPASGGFCGRVPTSRGS